MCCDDICCADGIGIKEKNNDTAEFVSAPGRLSKDISARKRLFVGGSLCFVLATFWRTY